LINNDKLYYLSEKRIDTNHRIINFAIDSVTSFSSSYHYSFKTRIKQFYSTRQEKKSSHNATYLFTDSVLFGGSQHVSITSPHINYAIKWGIDLWGIIIGVLLIGCIGGILYLFYMITNPQ
jgi:hypothetical protein